jgi:hypothetical protein
MATTAKKLFISEEEFEASHGRRPTGYGSWGFEVLDESCGKVVRIVWAPPSTLFEAKKWVRAWIQQNMAEEFATGWLYVSVAP